MISFFVAARASTVWRGRVRAVVHDAADADDAGAGILSKRIDDRLRTLDRLRGRGEHLVDDRHLAG